MILCAGSWRFFERAKQVNSNRIRQKFIFHIHFIGKIDRRDDKLRTFPRLEVDAVEREKAGALVDVSGQIFAFVDRLCKAVFGIDKKVNNGIFCQVSARMLKGIVEEKA